jgi:hypothetical protein
VLVFWANPLIRAKFPGRARVFNAVFAAITHEATSESTFSGAGRAFNKQRTRLGVGQLCDTVVCVSGEKLNPTKSTDVWPSFEELKGRQTERERPGRAVASVSLVGQKPPWELPSPTPTPGAPGAEDSSS